MFDVVQRKGELQAELQKGEQRLQALQQQREALDQQREAVTRSMLQIEGALAVLAEMEGELQAGAVPTESTAA